jgi:CDP-diglyceride synthetase
MSPKAAKILRRTAVGSTIGAVVIGLVLAAERFNHPGLVSGAATLVAACGAYELRRLPRFGGWEVGVALALAIAWSAFMVLESSADAWTGARRAPAGCEWPLLTLLAPAIASWLELRLLRFMRSSPRWLRPIAALLALGPWTLPLADSWIPDRSHELYLVAGAAAAAFVALSALSLFLATDRAPLEPVAALAAWLLPLLWIEFVFVDWGARGLLALLLLSKIGDTAGYYAGNAFGRHHPFKRISPGKTTEGCIASLVAGTATGAVVVALGWLPEGRSGVWGGLVAGAGVNLAAQAGDLFESLVKRRAGVKDSGTWFGPSGGVLDVVDSLLFTVPVALVSWPWLFGAGAPDG